MAVKKQTTTITGAELAQLLTGCKGRAVTVYYAYGGETYSGTIADVSGDLLSLANMTTTSAAGMTTQWDFGGPLMPAAGSSVAVQATKKSTTYTWRRGQGDCTLTVPSA